MRIFLKCLDKRKCAKQKGKDCGHVVRMKTGRFPQETMKWEPEKKRKRGRPRLTWQSTVNKDLKRLDMDWREAEDVARQRDVWRNVAALCANMHGKD